jgi:hypothetical protein
MSVKDWIIILTIVMFLVWAISGTGNVNRKNYCMASLIIIAVIFGLAICVSILVAVIGLALSA